MEACREKTVREYIETFCECAECKQAAERALQLYDDEKREYVNTYGYHIAKLERQKEEQDVIISCLVETLQRERSRI